MLVSSEILRVVEDLISELVPKNIVNVLVKLSSIVEGGRGNYCIYDNKMIFMSFT